MAEVVYLLCVATSLFCAVLLFRGHRRNPSSLLFWSAICFLGFALNNAILFIDVAVLQDTRLSVLRLVPALVGVGALLFGLVRQVVR